jgi:hypothetical protein
MWRSPGSPPASLAADPHGHVRALLEEAWQRARRRRLGTLGTVGILVLALAGIIASRGSEPRERAGVASPRPAALVLPKPPGIGVACPAAPNSIACDRVGIAVWLAHVPRRVNVVIAGHSVRLRAAQPRSQDCPCFFTGYLKPAGLIDGALRITPDAGRYRWYGRHPVTTTMRITATEANGPAATTTRRVELAPGWG